MNIATDEIWRVVSYQSGTITVQNFGPGGHADPHVGIHYREGNPATDEDRYVLAEKICRVLNDYDRYGWPFVRVNEVTGRWNGITFSPIGPMVDRNTPNCHWVEKDTPDAHRARVALMDSICGRQEG